MQHDKKLEMKTSVALQPDWPRHKHPQKEIEKVGKPWKSTHTAAYNLFN
jgi:hypothetical protein